MNKKVTLSLLSATVFASMAASAFAAPTQGVYMGGSVDKFYKLDDLFNLSAAAKKQFVVDMNAANPDGDFNNLVFVDFDGKGAKFSEILAKGTLSKAKRDLTKTDFEGSYVTVNLDGSNGVSYDPRNDAVDVPTGDLKVESVSAINAKEIQVNFGTEVDEDSAKAATYELSVATSSGKTIKIVTGSIELTEDGKGVILPLDNALAKGDTYRLNVKDVLSKDFEKIAEYKGTTAVFSDSTAPSLVSASLRADGSLRVTFNEPFTAGVLKVDGVEVATSITYAGPGLYYYTTAPLAAELRTPGTHTVTVYNAKDVVAGTPNEATVLTTTFTASVDTTAPTVTAVTAKDQTTFKIKFSEKLLANPTASNLVVKKGNFTINSKYIKVEPNAEGELNTYDVTIDAANMAKDDANNPLFATGETSINLSVEVKDFKDTANLLGTKYTGSVTLVADTVGPKMVSNNLNKVNAGKLEILFDENVAKVNAAKFVVKKDGIVQELAAGTPIVATGKKVVIEPKTAAGTGLYTVELAAGAVEDAAGNANTAFIATVDNTGSANAVIELKVGTNVSVTNNSIFINFGEEMDASAESLSNYKWDNGSFPAGTSIGFYNDKKQVRIVLPDNYFTVDTSAVVTVTSSVKNKYGKAVVKNSDGDLNVITFADKTFKDNVKPQLVSGAFVVNSLSDVKSNRIKLTFSENLAAVANDADTKADFAVKVNGNTVGIANVLDGTVGDKNVTIETSSDIVLSQPVTVEVVPVGSKNAKVDVTDATTATTKNTLVTGTNVSISDKVVDAGQVVSDTQDVAADTAALAVGFAEGEDEKNVTKDLTLPTAGAKGSTIAWSSADATVVANDGKVTRPSFTTGDKTVKLTATITKGAAKETKEFEVKVLKLAPTDAEAVAADKAEVALTFADGEDKDNVTKDIKLVAPANNGSTITWASDAPTVVDNTGKVTQPAKAVGDKTVKLTATVKKGSVTETVEFTVVVKASTV